MKMDIYFLSFADSKYAQTLDRIRKEAVDLAVFKDIYTWNETNLESSWLKNHKQFIYDFYYRGYGYWIWKSKVIEQTLDRIPEGSVLVYCDAGCTLKKEAISTLKYLCHQVRCWKGLGVLAFYLNYEESEWTKMDLMEYLHFEDYSSPAVQSGVLFFKNSKDVRQLVKRWQEVCCMNHYKYVDDSPSLSPNKPNFKEHRHDQSILGILLKQQGGLLMPVIWPDVDDFPIHSTRLKY